MRLASRSDVDTSPALCRRAQAGLDPKPEIMVPVVSTARELNLVVPRIKEAVKEVLAAEGVDVSRAHAEALRAVPWRGPGVHSCRVSIRGFFYAVISHPFFVERGVYSWGGGRGCSNSKS